MPQMYDDHGIRFQFPDEWELNEDLNDNELSISINSPGTSFWSLTVDFENRSPEMLVKSAIDAFRQAYQDVDSYTVESKICGRPTVARDLDFLWLELTNSAFLRAFRTERFSALVLYQETDHELEESLPILELITHSLECDEDDFGLFRVSSAEE